MEEDTEGNTPKNSKMSTGTKRKSVAWLKHVPQN